MYFYQNKIIPSPIMAICLLALLVINGSIYRAYGQSTPYSSEDYILLNQFLMSERAFLLDKPVRFILENNNTLVIDLFKELRDIELTRDTKKIDSIKERYFIKEPSFIREFKRQNGHSSQDGKDVYYKFDSIFNLNEYDHLISQAHTGAWNTNRIDPEIILGKTDVMGRKIRYSKPIYTKDKKWSFVQYTSSTASSILIYHLNDDSWKKYKEVNFYLISPRIKRSELNKY